MTEKFRNKQYSMMVNANSDLNDEIYEQLQKTEKALKRVCEENEQLKQQNNELIMVIKGIGRDTAQILSKNWKHWTYGDD